MNLEDANQRLNKLSSIPFGELFSQKDMHSIIINKGKTGQLLELALGLRLSNTNLDFENGELKTNKCDAFGNPKETVLKIPICMRKLKIFYMFLFVKMEILTNGCFYQVFILI